MTGSMTYIDKKLIKKLEVIQDIFKKRRVEISKIEASRLLAEISTINTDKKIVLNFTMIPPKKKKNYWTIGNL